MPDEIYNLAGQSSVAMSFELPMETMESINIGTLNLLEAIKFIGNGIKFYNAGSGECFGERKENPAKEKILLILEAHTQWQNHQLFGQPAITECLRYLCL